MRPRIVHWKQLLTAAAFMALVVPSAADTSVTFGGRIQVDAAFYDEDVSELGSGTEFRRARFFATGDILDQWGYKLEIDFADGDLEMKDAYVSYSGLSWGKLKIGQFKAPFSLEELNSSKYMVFMERGLPNAFVTSRRIGLGISGGQGSNTFSAAVYGDAAGDSASDEGLGFSARYTTAPKFSEQSFAHFGLGVSFEEPTTTDEGSDTIRFRTRPESHVTSTRLVNGGTLTDVNSVTKLGLEAAYVRGGFSIQGEYIDTTVDTDNGDADYSGYYAFISYFPWGGSRPYKKGAFARIKESNVWEFAVRYSNIDLSDTLGGEQNNITLGANYYVNPYLRVMANYVRADVEAGIAGDEDPSVIQLRVAMDF